MFSKIAIFTLSVFAAIATAAPAPGGSNGVNNSCNTGPVQCCNSLHKSNDVEISTLKTLLGPKVTDTNALIGLQCSPLTVVGVGSGASCSSQPVCCSGNDFDGLVAVGCSPVNI